jgi:hypothetical protein
MRPSELATCRSWVEDIMWGNNVTHLRIVLVDEVIEWVRGERWGTATMTRIPHKELLNDRAIDSGTSDS